MEVQAQGSITAPPLNTLLSSPLLSSPLLFSAAFLWLPLYRSGIFSPLLSPPLTSPFCPSLRSPLGVSVHYSSLLSSISPLRPFFSSLCFLLKKSISSLSSPLLPSPPLSCPVLSCLISVSSLLLPLLLPFPLACAADAVVPLQVSEEG